MLTSLSTNTSHASHIFTITLSHYIIALGNSRNHLSSLSLHFNCFIQLKINEVLIFKKAAALSVVMLCTCVYIYILQLSFLNTAPMLWFIDLTVITCHIQYTLLSWCHFFYKKKDKTQNTTSLSFSYETKMAVSGRCMQSIHKCDMSIT